MAATRWSRTSSSGIPLRAPPCPTTAAARAPRISPPFPDFKAGKLRWYQHFDFDTSARALVNRAGGVETNTLNVCQVEIVGTCDPATHKKWGTVAHLYTPELPDWAIRDLAAFAKWAHDEHRVPLTSGVTFKAYPGSYGTNGVRMSATKWNDYRGHCGHQHVPENDHGDPGAFPMARILDAAKGSSTSTYTVGRGDTLWSIAASKLGDGARWREIAELNRLRDADALTPGQRLRLPAK